MSALGQKQTFGEANSMSALPPIADIKPHRLECLLCASTGHLQHRNVAHHVAGGGVVHSIISEQPSLPVVEAAMYNVKVCTSMLKSC